MKNKAALTNIETVAAQQVLPLLDQEDSILTIFKLKK